MKLIDNTTQELSEWSVIDHDILINKKKARTIIDPCYAIFKWSNVKAPVGDREEAKRLRNWYKTLCKEFTEDGDEDFFPSLYMINTQFKVLCWNNKNIQAEIGKIYIATIEDVGRYSTDGFVLENEEVIDSPYLALLNFVIV